MQAIIWSKDQCPFCVQAKALLESRGIEIEERNVSHDWTKEQLLEAVPTARTLPQIFLDGVHVGGFNELKQRLAYLFKASDVTLDWLKQQVPGFETNKFFTVDWFTNGLINFEHVKAQMGTPPESILEIGCHEGRSTCWMLENLLSEDGAITCIDPFANEPLSAFRNEHPPENRIIEQVFRHNTDLAKKPDQTIRLMPTLSFYALAELITENKQFDFIYVDGSHSADEVLADAVMAFGLLKKNGYMIFDDYLWLLAKDSLDRPKMSIDAFVNMFQKHIEVKVINYQYVIQKV